MVPPKTTNDLFLERLAEGLDSTSKLTHALLSEIRDSEADFASIKTELSILRENVKGLSEIVREGNGATSILTRIALIEQRIQGIEKWMESHIDLHQSDRTDLTAVHEEITELDRKITSVTTIVNDMKQRTDEADKKKRESIDRELELQHEDKKTKITIAAERQSTIIKVLGALLLALLGAFSGYLANSCNAMAQPKPPIVAPATPSALPVVVTTAVPVPQPQALPVQPPSLQPAPKQSH